MCIDVDIGPLNFLTLSVTHYLANSEREMSENIYKYIGRHAVA
jgi:hypothetical protein